MVIFRQAVADRAAVRDAKDPEKICFLPDGRGFEDGDRGTSWHPSPNEALGFCDDIRPERCRLSAEPPTNFEAQALTGSGRPG